MTDKTNVKDHPATANKIASAAMLISLLALIASVGSVYLQWKSTRLSVATLRPSLTPALGGLTTSGDCISATFSINNLSQTTAVLHTLSLQVGSSKQLTFPLGDAAGAIVLPGKNREFTFKLKRFEKLESNGAIVDMLQTLRDANKVDLCSQFASEQAPDEGFTFAYTFSNIKEKMTEEATASAK